MELVRDPEDGVGGLDCGQAQSQGVVDDLGLIGLDAPQRVLGQLFDAGSLDFGIGQLELDGLEASQRLPELPVVQHV